MRQGLGASSFLLLIVCVSCGGSGTTADAGLDATSGDAHSIDATSADAPTADVPPIDSGCTTDSDGDGHRSIDCGGDDCDDTDANAYPGNPERCDTLGHDEDCNPMTLGPDGDHDDFVSTDCCNTQPDTTLACGQDCNDARATANPTAAEACNGSDDDCNGVIDDHDVLTTFFHDFDGDGLGDTAMPMQACAAPLGYALVGGDCNDALASTHPGATDGPTGNCDGVDNDCDGTPDRGCPCVNGAMQACGSSTTAPCHLGMQTCVGSAWSACMGAVEPIAETCNMVDDDCDGTVDDGARITCFVDADHDTYAPSGAAMSMECADSAGHCPTGFTGTAPSIPSAVDCNDGQATVHPGAIENCNSIDDDCDGLVDEAVATVWHDADGDGHGAGAPIMAGACVMTGYVTNGDDCNDADATIHPGAPELCGDGVDSNCAVPDDLDDSYASRWCRSLPHVTTGNECSFYSMSPTVACRQYDASFAAHSLECQPGWHDCNWGVGTNADGCECPTTMSCSGVSCV